MGSIKTCIVLSIIILISSEFIWYIIWPVPLDRLLSSVLSVVHKFKDSRLQSFPLQKCWNTCRLSGWWKVGEQNKPTPADWTDYIVHGVVAFLCHMVPRLQPVLGHHGWEWVVPWTDGSW